MSFDSASAPPGPDADRLAAAERALDALRRQQEVLAAGMSHDLRAPLRAIGSYASLIDERHAGALGEEGRGYLLRIREAAARMDTLIEGLLQLSHAVRAEPGCEPVDLSLLAEWSLAELRDTAQGAPIEATVQADLVALGDERQLKQLLDRVLQNARQFAIEGEAARIEVSGETVGGRLRLRVRDHGRGFDIRYAGRMFEPFQRLHPPEQGGGHGLGLAVAQAIVERHGGSISGQSEPGGGSVFEIDLPAPPAAGGSA